jgi:hypothetical protein
MIDIPLANTGTLLGAVCFLVGAALMLPAWRAAVRSRSGHPTKWLPSTAASEIDGLLRSVATRPRRAGEMPDCLNGAVWRADASATRVRPR